LQELLCSAQAGRAAMDARLVAADSLKEPGACGRDRRLHRSDTPRNPKTATAVSAALAEAGSDVFRSYSSTSSLPSACVMWCSEVGRYRSGPVNGSNGYRATTNGLQQKQETGAHKQNLTARWCSAAIYAFRSTSCYDWRC
jgi:hypothetical protein